MPSICLLVLLGATMISGAPSQFLTEKLMHNHETAAHALKLTQVDVITDPLFSNVIRSMNSSCQRQDDVQLMSATLDVYTHIFSSILEQQQDQAGALLNQVLPSQQLEVKESLRHLQGKMETLKKNLRQMNQEQEEVMAKLKTIQVDDLQVQKKALAQFKAVYQAASLIGRCGHAHSK